MTVELHLDDGSRLFVPATIMRRHRHVTDRDYAVTSFIKRHQAFMITTFGALGVISGATLSLLLALNARDTRLRIWPATHGSWQSYLFWFLFRTLNICTLLLSAVDWQPMIALDPIRIAAVSIAAVGAVLYISACIRLGRDNLYCGILGLTTSGIYRWSRNPQYAIAIPSYVALAIASQSHLLPVLVVLLVFVFWLMAVNEEPWLEAEYGAAYVEYKQAVPRFYNVGKLKLCSAGSAPHG